MAIIRNHTEKAYLIPTKTTKEARVRSVVVADNKPVVTYDHIEYEAAGEPVELGPALERGRSSDTEVTKEVAEYVRENEFFKKLLGSGSLTIMEQ